MSTDITDDLLCTPVLNDSTTSTPASVQVVNRHRNGTILFLVVAVGIGALVRHIFKRTPIPYTVILMVVGLLIGLASRSDQLSFLNDYTSIANIDPHLLLLVFLPTLIFESAFIMDFHTFKKTIFQALLLAGPGLLITTVLTAVMARYVFTYNWTWVTAIMFGAVLSATDPVSVVALLADLGTSKQLGTVIEGESLLNDGVAIVIFNVLLDELNPTVTRTGLDIFLYLLRVTLGGPAFGYIMARLTIIWLSYVFNDAVVEITITLASTYFTYYVGDVLLEVSGVLAVVTLGIEINARRTSISPEVEVFLLKFWGMLSYLANTLIFVLVGVVISQRAFSGVNSMDWVFMVSLYFGVNVIRLIAVAVLSPLIARAGYRLDWRNMIVITWSGLRGALGLSLALVVEQTRGIPQDTIGSKVLFHSAGIVILTLLVNATTVRYLLDTLGVSDISNARRLNMMTAIRRINETKAKTVRLLKSDRFLADAHWEVVDYKTHIDNPFDSGDEEDKTVISGSVVVSAADVETHCNTCNATVPRVPNHKELTELAEDARVKIIRAEKTSYWKQFEEGMLDKDSVVVLNNIADSAIDEPHKYIELKDFEPYWKIPSYLSYLRRVLSKLRAFKPSNPPRPKCWCSAFTHRLVQSAYFDWVILLVVLMDIILIILTLSLDEEISNASPYLRYVNGVFVGVYTSEAIMKLVGLRHYYFRDPFNLFDFTLLLVSWIDVLLTELDTMDLELTQSVVGFLRIILRAARILKLFKHVLPPAMKLVQWRIKRHVHQSYGLGKSFVVGEEEVLLQFDRIVSGVHKNVVKNMKKKIVKARLDVIRRLGQMKKEFPGVALSVKTRQAIRAVLNHCRSTLVELQEKGILEEHDAETLLRTIEGKMKRLQRYPVSQTPPDPYSIFSNHPWLSGLDSNVLRPLLKSAHLCKRKEGDVLLRSGELAPGLYIIVSGLVKVVTYKQMNGSFSQSSPSSMAAIHGWDKDQIHRPRSTSDITELHQSDTRRSRLNSPSTQLLLQPPLAQSTSSTNNVDTVDFYDVGNVLGEIGILEKAVSKIDAECETDAQLYFIEREKLEKLMKEQTVLEERMWKILAVHISSTLLIQTPEYQDWPINKLLLMLYDGAHLLPPQSSGIIEIKNEWKQVIIISGEVISVDTNVTLEAPCIVPPKVGHLLIKQGNPKVMVISSTSSGKDYEDHGYYRYKRHYKRTWKTFLAKIKLLVWARCTSLKDMLSRGMNRFLSCVLGPFSRCGVRGSNVVAPEDDWSLKSQAGDDQIIQIDAPPEEPGPSTLPQDKVDPTHLKVPIRFSLEEAKLQSQLALLRNIRINSGGTSRAREILSEEEMQEITAGNVKYSRSSSPLAVLEEGARAGPIFHIGSFESTSDPPPSVSVIGEDDTVVQKNKKHSGSATASHSSSQRGRRWSNKDRAEHQDKQSSLAKDATEYDMPEHLEGRRRSSGLVNADVAGKKKGSLEEIDIGTSQHWWSRRRSSIVKGDDVASKKKSSVAEAQESDMPHNFWAWRRSSIVKGDDLSSRKKGSLAEMSDIQESDMPHRLRDRRRSSIIKGDDLSSRKKGSLSEMSDIQESDMPHRFRDRRRNSILKGDDFVSRKKGSLSEMSDIQESDVLWERRKGSILKDDDVASKKISSPNQESDMPQPLGERKRSSILKNSDVSPSARKRKISIIDSDHPQLIGRGSKTVRIQEDNDQLLRRRVSDFSSSPDLPLLQLSSAVAIDRARARRRKSHRQRSDSAPVKALTDFSETTNNLSKFGTRSNSVSVYNFLPSTNRRILRELMAASGKRTSDSSEGASEVLPSTNARSNSERVLRETEVAVEEKKYSSCDQLKLPVPKRSRRNVVLLPKIKLSSADQDLETAKREKAAPSTSPEEKSDTREQNSDKVDTVDSTESKLGQKTGVKIADWSLDTEKKDEEQASHM